MNTGAIPDGVFESELFGHVKGAFTDARTDRIGRFELADGGTIFLDEIGNVPLRQQAKLLRVLESGEIERVGSSRSRRVNVRVLSATNSDLPAACAAGQFREDLLFRLEHGGDSCSGAARTPRRYPGAGGAFPIAVCLALSAAGAKIRSGRHSGLEAISRGRAMCANWSTRSSAPC